MSHPILPTIRPKTSSSESTTSKLRIVLKADGAMAGPHVEHYLDGVRAFRLYDVEGYEEAVVHLRRALDLEPGFGPGWACLAETYSHWGFRNEVAGEDGRPLYRLSFECAQSALHFAPERSDSHRAMAVALRRGAHADPVARREQVLTALDLDPNDASNWHEYWRAGGYQLPEGSIDRCLELDPRHCGARIDLGAALVVRRRYQEAAREFALALQVNPRNSLASFNLAMTVGRLGHRAKAAELLRGALKVRPGDALLQDGFKHLGVEAPRLGVAGGFSGG